MTNNALNDAAAKLGEATAQATTKVKQFRRSRTDRMVAGVCGGAAKMLGIDAALLRILLVAATLFGVGAGAILYLAAWVLVPEEA
ncbi:MULTISPECIES: PspC domain-containing protein [Actinosynnema]|uniref:PspC domain-containing protein n=1 Tax=Actinosynnema TaxID=40566 RepID=UPI0020A2F0DB|nr:PspC domain-containing protein [Actinosynnema pretiosum]MCP2096768.1 phage shock protein C (PspC) family protein [Actinosynnema pretiosum]